ncbi:hypothetical protein EPI10_006583 [Gossypium australe]|uniref:Uncharacterized protein n=1 Tax=Gossypium australe TaxID=47621 RepID=A0A5B6WUI6_9ROSI|nr:hypothetical protein EPI10_006583 [Gossypium australe]
MLNGVINSFWHHTSGCGRNVQGEFQQQRPLTFASHSPRQIPLTPPEMESDDGSNLKAGPRLQFDLGIMLS